ncbi:hypothetical protein T492DRAFT_1066416 [Pavlovales sp. CCMP2436]|nr:hypothetical protein T492DRAFT_1066416 [Pavlovales sp. CCMP2436]
MRQCVCTRVQPPSEAPAVQQQILRHTAHTHSPARSSSAAYSLMPSTAAACAPSGPYRFM